MEYKGEANGEICIGACRILRRMDLVATDLKAAGHLVEAFDLPGMGNDHMSASEVSLDSYAGRVCEVLAANSEPAIVVGHSVVGGIVATQAAARCP